MLFLLHKEEMMKIIRLVLLSMIVFSLSGCDMLGVEEFPDLDNEKVTGKKWTKSCFNALLTIIKQIRDNLFHGRKIELAPEQYNRNKELIGLSVELTTVILDNLENAEKETNKNK